MINKGGIPEELRRQDDPLYRAVQMHFWTQTDAVGRYELFLGPGEYELRGPPRTTLIKLTIPAVDPPTEIVHNFKTPRPETGPFKLRVVDQRGQPVAGAVVSGQYASMQARRSFRQMKTDSEGLLMVERSLDPLVLHAQSADQRLAGMTRVDAEQLHAEVIVVPTAKASGRLTDFEGQPIANREFRYGVVIHMGEPGRSAFITSFGGDAITDAEGRFALENLVPGERYDVTIRLDERSSRRVVHVTPSGPGETALGDIKADPEAPKPYVPPTPAERAAAAIEAHPEESPRQRLDRMLVESRREYTRPLVLFGTEDDPACLELFRLFYETAGESQADATAKPPLPSIASMRWEFELMVLSRQDPRVRELAEQLGVKTVLDEPPFLAVLDDKGAVIATYALRLREGKLDNQPLARFLYEHKLPTRDAQRMLARALEQARDDKRVFLILSASWCGPCRKLSAFLADHEADLKRHFVFVKIDISRDQHAADLQARYKESRSGGVPWFTVLSEEGKVIVTSNAPKLDGDSSNTNVGYPSEPKAIDHFISMLQQTAPRMTADMLEELRASLSKRL
ncbi:MAG: thioredoxin family protein [Planctomycetes bacterium]|nr:thioredoxin family protein [Planctomycetota bacterium]